MKPSLDIIIVNWNGGKDLAACLESVCATSPNGFDLKRVVIVDNDSSDRSVANLHSPDLPLTLIQNHENRGFAAAANQGARGSLADYLLFLNPDCRLLPDSLRIPVQFLEEPVNRGVGICGVQLLDEKHNVSRSCSFFPTPSSFFVHILGLDRIFPKQFKGYFLSLQDHLKSGPVDQVMGAFLLVRSKIFETLRGFDERFFVYFEDLDFSYRANQDGWRSYHLASAQASHRGGGCTERVKARRLYYSLSSRILYSYKHFGRAAATAVMLGTVLLEPVSRLVLAATHKSVREMKETLQAYRMLWRALPSLLRNRASKDTYHDVSPKAVRSISAE